jgi:putative SOS response-associated peptidase YedK
MNPARRRRVLLLVAVIAALGVAATLVLSALQPMRIGMKDGSVFGLAGLYERWLTPQGEPLDTCTILTTDANALLRRLHDRMPVIVPREAFEQWLDPTTSDAETLLAPCDPASMTFWPVAARVNNVRNDDAACIERIAANEADVEEATAPAQPALDESESPAKPVQAELF